MNKQKVLRPPHVWQNQKVGVVEDARVKRWSTEQVRAMRNGTYDWTKHKERQA